MYLKSIKLANFKNYSDVEVEFSHKINCFVGNNGVGKTNLLDAIYYLSFCKSYFNSIDNQNIKYDEPFFAIHGSYIFPDSNDEQLVSCVLKRGTAKQMKFNKKAYTRFADHIGKIPLVMISPYDQELINEGSDMRRKFIDGIISQTDRQYLDQLLKYQKVLEQRNSLLKQFFENRYFEEDQLRLWDEQMVRFGQPVHERRKAFVAEHMDAFSSAYAKPRAMLDNWLQQIISTCREHPDETVISSLNSMRGWLDDSMINFLSGDASTVNVIDRKTGKRSINIKRMPKTRRKYIAMCMALGMTTDDIDPFLEMMGYATIDVSDSDEGKLLMALTEWENMHPLQRAYKNSHFKDLVSVDLSPAEEYRAVREMLQLRSDLAEAYKHKGYDFIYI